MSRVILSRHDNSEEHITVGWDRPLQHYFWSECDRDGESVDESYMDRGLAPREVDEFFKAAADHNRSVYDVMMEVNDREDHGMLAAMLNAHKTLEYPASNVTLDLSVKE